MNRAVAKEVKVAYGDCHGNGRGQRKLDWRASEPVRLADAVDIMVMFVGRYNDFDPQRLWQLPKESRVLIAREGSPCVYAFLPDTMEVDSKSKILRSLKDAMAADELTYEGWNVSYPGNCIRIWWD